MVFQDLERSKNEGCVGQSQVATACEPALRLCACPGASDDGGWRCECPDDGWDSLCVEMNIWFGARQASISASGMIAGFEDLLSVVTRNFTKWNVEFV